MNSTHHGCCEGCLRQKLLIHVNGPSGYLCLDCRQDERNQKDIRETLANDPFKEIKIP